MNIGMTSWSPQPKSLIQALDIAQELGMDCIHLGFFDEASLQAETLAAVEDWLEENSVFISATCLAFDGEDYTSLQTIHQTGGYLLDERYPERLDKTKRAAAATQLLGVDILSAHAGFIPESPADPAYDVMLGRVREVCDVLNEYGLKLGLESGQEKAETLLAFLDALQRDNICVNYDPANMILYGNQEPLDALKLLRDRVEHVHMKDACWTKEPGTWGVEVPLGQGEADIKQIVAYLAQTNYDGALVIEREAGDDRVGDIARGKAYLDCILV
ncbi:MAG: sugar phosphate isomerase/epimerase family protein [Verrucomicrobiota bacterium]|jgi:L-ribulose-5-phosphate 3-epimerase